MDKVLSESSLEFVQKIYGSLESIEASKVLYSILITERNGSYNVIVKNDKTPDFEIDWESFCFVRATSDAFITTGEVIRAEKDISSMTKLECFGRSDWEDLYKLSGTQKRSLVLSKRTTKEDLLSLPFYQQTPHINKLLTTNDTLVSQIKEDESLQVFLKENSIQLVPSFPNILDAVKYLRTEFPENRILVETGVQASEPIFSITDPEKQVLDFLIVTVYRGDLDEQFVGRDHPSIESLTKKFNIFNISKPLPVYKGTVQFYSFVKKNFLFSS